MTSSFTTTPLVLDVTDTARAPFSRLVRVESRKARDTRAGFWLLLITGVLELIVLVIVCLVGMFGDMGANPPGFQDLFLQVMLFPVSLLVPVFAITIVTSEWGQRSALTTFALEPSRMRVLLAKLVVSVLMALGTLVVAAICAAIANMIVAAGQGYSAEWSVDGQKFFVTVLVQVLAFITAFGLAMCFLSSPASISVYYIVTLILPLIAYAILFNLFGWFASTIPWLDFNYASMPWTSDRWPDNTKTVVDGLAWARLGSATIIWLVLPLGIGFTRILRAEVK